VGDHITEEHLGLVERGDEDVGEAGHLIQRESLLGSELGRSSQEKLHLLRNEGEDHRI
jgi:hypothetical protein